MNRNQNQGEGDVEEEHGQDEGNRQLGRRALHAQGKLVQAVPGGLIGGPVQAAPLVHDMQNQYFCKCKITFA